MYCFILVFQHKVNDNPPACTCLLPSFNQPTEKNHMSKQNLCTNETTRIEGQYVQLLSVIFIDISTCWIHIYRNSCCSVDDITD